MKGFNTSDGYMGLVDGKYILFASESDYYDPLLNRSEEADETAIFYYVSSDIENEIVKVMTGISYGKVFF